MSKKTLFFTEKILKGLLLKISSYSCSQSQQLENFPWYSAKSIPSSPPSNEVSERPPKLSVYGSGCICQLMDTGECGRDIMKHFF
jgi:hypothetical protein